MSLLKTHTLTLNQSQVVLRGNCFYSHEEVKDGIPVTTEVNDKERIANTKNIFPCYDSNITTKLEPIEIYKYVKYKLCSLGSTLTCVRVIYSALCTSLPSWQFVELKKKIQL